MIKFVEIEVALPGIGGVAMKFSIMHVCCLCILVPNIIVRVLLLGYYRRIYLNNDGVSSGIFCDFFFRH